jgi:hypothetical protein
MEMSHTPLAALWTQTSHCFHLGNFGLDGVKFYGRLINESSNLSPAPLFADPRSFDYKHQLDFNFNHSTTALAL